MSVAEQLELSISFRCKVRTRIQTPAGNFYIYLYTNGCDEKEHLAIVFDKDLSEGHFDRVEIASKSLSKYLLEHPEETTFCDIKTPKQQSSNGYHQNGHSSHSNGHYEENGHNHAAAEKPVLIRVHSECFTGEVLGSMSCDCCEQLHTAMEMIAAEGRGIILYLRQEGRGAGLFSKLRAYNLMERGYDTVEAYKLLQRQVDERCYDICGQILDDLSVKRVRLLTNNPDKINALTDMGVEVVERLEMKPTVVSSELLSYLKTKITKMNHLLNIS